MVLDMSTTHRRITEGDTTMSTNTRTEYTTTYRGDDLGLTFESVEELSTYVQSGITAGNDAADYGPALVRTVTVTRTEWEPVKVEARS